jgi:hypothetical protein
MIRFKDDDDGFTVTTDPSEPFSIPLINIIFLRLSAAVSEEQVSSHA